MESLFPLRRRRAIGRSGLGWRQWEVERGCREGHRSGWGQCHVTWSSLQASGLGLFFRVGGAAPRAEPGSASAAAWRLLAALGRQLSRLPARVSQPALRLLGAAGEGGQPALTPRSCGEGDLSESRRGAGSAVSSKWGAKAPAGDKRRIPCLAGPFMCVYSIRVA